MASYVDELIARASMADAFAFLHRLCREHPSQFLAPLRRELLVQSCRLSDLDREAQGGLVRVEDEAAARQRIAGSLREIAADIEGIVGAEDMRRQVDEMLLHHAGARDAAPSPARAADAGLDVFVSYAHLDRETAYAIAEELGRFRLNVWIDRRISGGERFSDAIREALDSARAVVVLWTRHAIRSDWVAYEARRAHQQGKHIPLIAGDIHVDELPPPYPAIVHAIPVGDSDQLRSALIRLQIRC
jgi:TIR domain-containing protein/effector-associated domain 11 (EAD11)-containing protein